MAGASGDQGNGDRVRRLQRLSEALALASTATGVAVVAAEAGLAAAGSVSGSVWLPDVDALVAAHVVWTNEDRPGRSVTPVPFTAELPAAEAYRTGSPVWVGDRATSAARFPALGETEAPAYFALPLVGTKTVLGVFAGSLSGSPTDDDKAFFLAIASLCAQALERTQLYERERQARETLEFLAEATALMVSAADPDEVLQMLVRLATFGLGQWCAAYVADGDRLTRVAVAVVGDDDLAAHIAQAPDIPLGGDSPVARVFRTRVAEKVPVDGRSVRSLYGEATAARIDSLGVTAALALPITYGDQALGVLGLATAGSVDTDEFRFAASGLAARAAIALENATRHRDERELVRTLTDALLPSRLPTVEGYELAARYVPSSGGVCGDWYEAGIGATGLLWFAVGDASGHGISAASTMALVRNAAIGLREVEKEPARLITMLSRVVEHARPSEIVTAIHGTLEPASGHLRWCSAGHPHGMVASPDGTAQELTGVHGPPLGVAAGHRANWHRLDRGDTLVLYTDGVIERRGEDLRDGTERLRRVVAAPAATADELADRIVEQLCTDPDDDCCLLVIGRRFDV